MTGCVFFAGRGDFKFAAGFADYFDVYVYPFLRQTTSHAVGPFDEHQAIGFEIFLRTKGKEFILVAQPIGVDVIKRFSAVIFLDEHECGADDLAAIDAQGLGHGLHQPGLARPQRPIQGHDRSAGQRLRQCGAQRAVSVSSAAVKVKWFTYLSYGK